MKYVENIQQVAALQPDYLGVIFYKKSKRNFENEILELATSIKKIGVFVNASFQEIISKIKYHDLQGVQLHGNETLSYIKELKKMLGNNQKLEIIKSFLVDNSFDFQQTIEYENVSNYFLFDTKGLYYGGNGKKFDWKLLENYKGKTPYMLSGGISISDIGDIKKFLKTKIAKKCIAIDVNSKFEIKPGLKDIQKLKLFKNEISISSR